MKLQRELSGKVLKIYLLKYSLNEKKSVLSETAAVSFLSNIKKTLFLLMQFHKAGKQIMFIGLTNKTKLFIAKHTKHVSINSNIDLKDFISKGFYLDSLGSKAVNQNSRRIRPDLIVVVSHYQKEMLLKECIRLKLPFVNYNFYSNVLEINSATTIRKKESSINSESQINTSYFFEICLLFLIKKIFKYSDVLKKNFKKKIPARGFNSK